MDLPLPVALVSASPLLRAGLRAGLIDWPPLVLVGADFESLAEARAAAFDGARVCIVDGDPDDDSVPGAEADRDEAKDNIDGRENDFDAGPALVLLASADGTAAAQWLAAGHSVLARHAPLAQIAAAVQAAATGLVVSSREWAASNFDAGAEAERRAASMNLEALTPREYEVLARMSEGLGNRAIAERLQISPHTAKFHVAQIIAKLDASSRAHAVAKALRAGLVEL
ncbi:MAG: response regulator transcription factor [Burkholderiaceae bacterium]